MLRELLDVQRRVLGPEDPTTLDTTGNLGNALSGQGKHAEAEQTQRELLSALPRSNDCLDRRHTTHQYGTTVLSTSARILPATYIGLWPFPLHA
jgi:hypothetical protein